MLLTRLALFAALAAPLAFAQADLDDAAARAAIENERARAAEQLNPAAPQAPATEAEAAQGAAAADAAEQLAVEGPPSEEQLALAAANQAGQPGPAKIALGAQANINLPEGFTYVPQAETNRLLKSWGNGEDPDILGSIWGDGDWFVVIEFDAEGYIRDEEAKDWDVDAMLDNYKEGTEQQNVARREQGQPELEITGWVQKPTYDASKHLLVWSMSSKHKDAPADAEQGINYNTFALGREGYITLNLVTNLKDVEAQKPIAQQLLAAVEYNEGKRYADFNESTDKVAEYGIAALVGGVAAKKLGLFAALGVLVLKFWKIGLIALAGLGVVIAKFFGKKDGA